MPYPILESLSNGNAVPWERSNPPSAEYKALKERIENEVQYFMKKLPPEDHERLSELERLYHDIAVCERDGSYSYGFAVGALLIMELVDQKQAIIGE